MLSTHEKNQLRVTVQDFNFSKEEKNGLPIINGKPFATPSFDDLKRNAYEQIREQNFDFIQPISEQNADCIVRVYRLIHYPYDSETIINMFGYQCYTKKSKGFKTMSIYGKKEEYSRQKCTIKLWTSDDNYINFDCEFRDYFVKVGKMAI